MTVAGQIFRRQMDFSNEIILRRCVDEGATDGGGDILVEFCNQVWES